MKSLWTVGQFTGIGFSLGVEGSGFRRVLDVKAFVPCVQDFWGFVD